MSPFWESIKKSLSPSNTADPVPWAVRYALHASLAALQALFLVLLCLDVAGLRTHYLVLGVLCGGLWASVTWFLRELDAAEAGKTK